MLAAMGEEEVSKYRNGLAISRVERQCRRKIAPPHGRKFAKRKTRRGNAITLRRPRSLGRDETRGNKREDMLVALKFHRVKRKEREKERKKDKK